MSSPLPPSLPLTRPGQPPVLFYCKQCREARLFSASDDAPSYAIHGDELEESVDDERAAFLQRHQRHELVALKRKKDHFWADRPLDDPLRIAYEEVTDGHESWLLKSWRSAVAAPRNYVVLQGRLEVTTTITLPQEPLRTALAQCFPSHTAADIASLTRQMQRAVSALSPDDLIPGYCSADDPTLSFASLSAHQRQTLLRQCSTASLPFETRQLQNFLNNSQQDDTLLIEIRQQYRPLFL